MNAYNETGLYPDSWIYNTGANKELEKDRETKSILYRHIIKCTNAIKYTKCIYAHNEIIPWYMILIIPIQTL